MGLDSSQACINFCSGYSVFLEAHLQAIINSLECWQNIQTCRQASDDTALGKSSGSRPKPEQGGERESAPCEPRRVASPRPPVSPRHTWQPPGTKGRRWGSEPRMAPHTGLLRHAQPPEGLRGVKGPEEGSSWLPPGSALTGKLTGREQRHSLDRGHEATRGLGPAWVAPNLSLSGDTVWEKRGE